MKEEPIIFSPPPRLLLGVTFLFWGAMHDRPLPALAAAVLMEGRHWTNLRWSFGEKGFARSWQFSVLILIISALGLLQREERVTLDFLMLLSWLPFMMLPLVLAEQYSNERGVPMTTFSFIARRKLAADRKAGRETQKREVNLGYPYFFLLLIVSGMGVGSLLNMGANEVRYGIGVAILLGWGLFKMGQMKGTQNRKQAWLVGYAASLVMAVGMSWGILDAYRGFLKSLTRTSPQAGAPFETQTSIGQVHKLQLSPKIMWRYEHEEGVVPRLVRISSYNWPEGDLWRTRTRRRVQKERISPEREAGGDFEKFLSVGEGAFAFDEQDLRVEVDEVTTRGSIMGLVSDQALIPHPLRTRRLERVPTEFLSANSMGAIQLNGLRQAAMKAELFVNEMDEALEHDPSVIDLLCPPREEPGLDGFLREQGLRPMSWKPRMLKGSSITEQNSVAPEDVSRVDARIIEGKLGEVFRRDFTYSLILSGADLGAPISEFVTEKRRGHCEYFAGATCLLLRRMGVPSRYVVGFAVQEESSKRGEYLLRGKHAHAWAEAYVGGTWVNEARPENSSPLWRCRGGKWVDVDLTPPDWLAEADRNHWFQGLSDWWQNARVQLVLWVSKEGIVKGLKVVLFVVGGGFLIYLIHRLIQTRGRKGDQPVGAWAEKVKKQGVLRDFERWLARRVGPRPTSMPMASWLRTHLPEGGERFVACYEAATFDPARVSSAELVEETRLAKVRWKRAQKTP